MENWNAKTLNRLIFLQVLRNCNQPFSLQIVFEKKILALKEKCVD